MITCLLSKENFGMQVNRFTGNKVIENRESIPIKSHTFSELSIIYYIFYSTIDNGSDNITT